MSRSFYLFPDKKGNFRAEILNPDTGVKICYRTVHAKSREEATIIVSSWLLRDGIPARKRGRHPVFRTSTAQPVEAAIGLNAIIKSIENTPDLDQNAAIQIAQLLKKKGLLTISVSPASRGNQGFIQFLLDYWDYDKSEYLQDKRVHGKDVTKLTCRDNKNAIERHWKPFFKDKTLSEITRQDLRKFCLSLLKDKVSGKTVNNIFSIGGSAIRWAAREKIIPENIAEGLGGYIGGGKARDILRTEETEKLFNEKHWENKMAYAATLLAATSGLRNGEIRSLKRNAIGDKLYQIKTESGQIQNVYLLAVDSNWNFLDGLKLPKNGEKGTVHLLPEVRDKLLALLDENPHKDIPYEDRFIFWGIKKDRPCGAPQLLKGLRKAIENAEIEIGNRKIDLHSFRHAHGTTLFKKTGDIRKVAQALRHKDKEGKSLKVTENYVNHVFEEDIAAVGATAAEAFSNILKFPEKKGA